MADDVPEVAAEYGPPNPFEASPDQPGAYGPPTDVFTGGSSGTSSGTAGNSLDLSGLIKAGVEGIGNVVKAAGNLATPPAPKIPMPPSAPNLPASIPPLPAVPAAPAPASAPPAPRPPNPVAPPSAAATPQPRPKLSTGAKVAIGVGVGGVLVGGGLLIASAGGKRKR